MFTLTFCSLVHSGPSVSRRPPGRASSCYLMSHASSAALHSRAYPPWHRLAPAALFPD